MYEPCYNNVMRKTLTRVGNSEALVISKELKELTGIQHEVEIQVVGNVLLIAPAGDDAALREGKRAAILRAAVTEVLDENDEVLGRLKNA